MSAQKTILAELDRQFGGSAEAQATATAKLQVAWGNVQEQLGTALLPLVERVASWLAEHLPGAIDTTTRFFNDHLKPVLVDIGHWLRDDLAPAIATAWHWFNDNLQPVIKDVATWFYEFGVPAVKAMSETMKDLAVQVQNVIGWFQDMAGYVSRSIDTMLGPIDELVDKLGILDRLNPFGGSKRNREVEAVLNSLGVNDYEISLSGRASGGPVRAGVPYVVGEHRPELFVPDSNGSILPFVPRGGGGGFSGTVVIPVSIGGRVVAEVVASELNRPGGPKITQRAIA
jgi:hypothetical protein